MSYPAYTRAERLADGAVHVLGVGAALIGVAGLFWLMSARMDWGLALGGVVAKLRAARGKMTTGWAPYLGLGCLGIAVIWPLSEILPTLSLWLMLGGGALYAAGIVFYAWEKLRFANAIWHVFVLAASACYFFGISTAVTAGVAF